MSFETGEYLNTEDGRIKIVKQYDDGKFGYVFIPKKIKRIIEIKRGDDVPLNAKWLESVHKYPGPTPNVNKWVLHDVFEVEE